MLVERLLNYPNARVYASNIEDPSIRRIALAELSVISAYAGVDVLGPDKFDEFLRLLDKRVEKEVLYLVREKMEESFTNVSTQLSKNGILSVKDSKRIWSKFDFDKYAKESFYSHSLAYRAKKANRFIKKDLEALHGYLKNKPGYSRGIQSYLRSSKAVFPTSRLVITETSRALRKPIEVIGKELGNKVIYHWELSALGGRKPDICDEIYSESPFTIDTLPAVPHSTCMCNVSMEVKGKKIHTT